MRNFSEGLALSIVPFQKVQREVIYFSYVVKNWKICRKLFKNCSLHSTNDTVINDSTLMELVFMKVGSLSSYKILNTHVTFAYSLALLKSWLTPQFWFSIVLKYYSEEFCSCEMRIFYSLADVTFRFNSLLIVVLNGCRKVYNLLLFYCEKPRRFTGLSGDSTMGTLRE